MEKRSLTLSPFTRTGLPELQEGIVLSHCVEALAIQEEVRYEQIALEYCKPDNKGRLCMHYHTKPQIGVIPFDIELAQHFIIRNKHLFIKLLEKTPGAMGNEVMILCTGTSFYRNGIPTRSLYVRYLRKENSIELGDIGNEYKGYLPKTFRLVYYPTKNRNVA